MSLISEFSVPCVLLDKTRVSDGEGGFVVVWVEGVEFEAAITCDNSLEARVAEVQGVTSKYTVVTHRGLGLEYHDVFKRKQDGKVFRVTSDSVDKQTPKAASFSFEQVTAEEWELAT